MLLFGFFLILCASTAFLSGAVLIAASFMDREAWGCWLALLKLVAVLVLITSICALVIGIGWQGYLYVREDVTQWVEEARDFEPAELAPQVVEPAAVVPQPTLATPEQPTGQSGENNINLDYTHCLAPFLGLGLIALLIKTYRIGIFGCGCSVAAVLVIAALLILGVGVVSKDLAVSISLTLVVVITVVAVMCVVLVIESFIFAWKDRNNPSPDRMGYEDTRVFWYPD